MPDAERPSVSRRAAEGLFRVGSWAFHRAYDSGVCRPRRLPEPVVSVGNLAVGGTGKTPVVCAVAAAFLRRGVRTAILSRGYRARLERGVFRAGAGADGTPVSAHDAGDEPLWLSRQLPEVPVVIGKDRFREAKALVAGGTTVDLWLLDDGFQHRRLHRDLDVVLVDALAPLGNGRLLPAGPLREPAPALARADVVLLTGGEVSEAAPEPTRRLVRERAPGARCLRVWTEAAGTWRLGARASGEAPPDLAGVAVWAVAGIARPERFEEFLVARGARIRGTSFFPDHHAFTEEDVREAARRAAQAGATPVTTEKDAVRLLDVENLPGDWWVAGIRTEVEGGWDAFAEHALARVADAG